MDCGFDLLKEMLIDFWKYLLYDIAMKVHRQSAKLWENEVMKSHLPYQFSVHSPEAHDRVQERMQRLMKCQERTRPTIIYVKGS